MGENWRKDETEWMDEYLEDGGKPILDGLEEQQLFEITLTPKGARIIDKVDEYFGCTLTKAQLDKLIQELMDLSKQLGEQEPWKEKS